MHGPFARRRRGALTKAAGFDTKGWQVDVDGLVHAPRAFDLDDLRKLAKAEERIGRRPGGRGIPINSLPGTTLDVAGTTVTALSGYDMFDASFPP